MSSPAFATVHKRASSDGGATPNMPAYAEARASFDWSRARAEYGGRGINIAAVALDRQLAAGRGDRLALRFVDRAGRRRDFSYLRLARDAGRFANVLVGLGLPRGARVFALLPRCPALHVSALGTLKAGMVFCPLFSAFGPEPVRMRLELGEATVLVTTAALYARKVAALRAGLPSLRHVLVVPGGEPCPPDTLDFDAQVAAAPAEFATVDTGDEEIALLHFTSGTTGKPKGVLHAHAGVVALHHTARTVLDLKDGDRYWCTADPGWVTGMAYGVLAPLTCGVSVIVDEEEFDPERWYRLLEEERISVWYTAPTAIRMLMKAGTALAQARRYPRLRHLASVGEPLNPEAVLWGVAAFGLPFHDNWWQTETGAIMVANYPAVDVRPGSMGLPVPGIEAAIVRRREDGAAELLADGETGELALRRPWPSMMRGYLNEDARYRACFAGEWYLSGDLARRDADGYFWFVGRGDDVIKSAGHLIGPFEVESALMEHPAVAEAGVIGKPDPMLGEMVKAFVMLKAGYQESEALRGQILGHARKRLGAAVAPKEIAFAATLPRTRSGKIMRRLLKARELGLPEGDTSTLEGSV
jgi:acetyl-CoA synthetase